MPASSKTDPPLAKAKPISASVITYLRRKKTKALPPWLIGLALASGGSVLELDDILALSDTGEASGSFSQKPVAL
ncbi:zinc finger protein 462-like [Grus japonensis]|uniref:Zinc finger protein 462-like n=1 Tax=Grus japonensis TaxID=30415 RepID=A0ABC9W7L3_GRUJA